MAVQPLLDLSQSLAVPSTLNKCLIVSSLCPLSSSLYLPSTMTLPPRLSYSVSLIPNVLDVELQYGFKFILGHPLLLKGSWARHLNLRLQWRGSGANSGKGQDNCVKPSCIERVYLPASASSSSPRHCWYTSRTSWSSNPLSSYNGTVKMRQNTAFYLTAEILGCSHCKFLKIFIFLF